jgi:uncharacterized membrane protein YphA (DoxX/SURF4 family)
VGLLLLRVLVGVTLIAQTRALVASSNLTVTGWSIAALLVLGGACLLLGFLTPIAAALIALASLSLLFASHSTQTLDIVVLSAVIALLGPGAFSIDARMFGRREILIPRAPRVRE